MEILILHWKTAANDSVYAILCLPVEPLADLPAVVYLQGADAFAPPPPEIKPDIDDSMPYNIHRKLAENGSFDLSILYYSRTPPPSGGEVLNTFIGVYVLEIVKTRPIWFTTIEDGLSYIGARPEVDPEWNGLAC